jgi:hypothetical protein
MKKLTIICTLLMLLIIFPCLVFADLKVQVVKESELEFHLSSQNPVNSPDASNNSIKNPGNSPANQKNASSIPENSPGKTENTINGNRRLLFEKDGTYYFIGYFVVGEKRFINFFSPFGKRMFYTPSGSSALFGSENGEFCGTLSTANNKTTLLLTEKGQSILKNEGVPPFRPTDTNVQKSLTGEYTNTGIEYRIKANYDGSTIVLGDGSIWDVDPADKMTSEMWKYSALITVTNTNGGKYQYLLSNGEDNRKVRANYIGKR